MKTIFGGEVVELIIIAEMERKQITLSQDLFLKTARHDTAR